MTAKLKYILTLILILSSYVFGQEPSWEISGQMKYPVSGARAVVHNDLVYVIGGYSDSLQANVRWIQRFNPTTGEWAIVANMIDKRYGVVAGIYYDKLYVYGGINEVNDNSFVLEEWDFVSSTTKKYNTNELFDRVFSTGAVSNDSFIMIGGYAASRGSGAELPYISKFDFQSLQINSIDDTSYLSNELPIQQMSVKVDNKLYVIGGAFNGVLQNFDVIDLGDYSSSSFESRIISPRAAGSAVYSSYSGMIYLIGGYNETSPAIASTEIITDFTSNPIVSEAALLNYARRNLCSVVYNEKIYVFGGENANGQVVKQVESIYAGPNDVDEPSDVLNNFVLHQNYPNPFNPETNISFTLNNASNITIEIFNSLGVKVKTLYKGYSYAGRHTLSWAGEDSEGNRVSTGVYIYRLSTEENFVTKKMLLLK